MATSSLTDHQPWYQRFQWFNFSMLNTTAYGPTNLTQHPLPEMLLAAFSAGSLQGFIRFWVREHRLHHRHTDTGLDPYSVNKGLLHTHIL
ncbi:hypothetical protein ABOM_012183 [Aspergillus bombycis]|uniref:Fatty acid desaturase domain-containing protein n=1 Tax=Aspergillus bombycis TaxID=109264 RepID=A0A1F7ZJC1_9EURO|nr:hypothetical protein ABOM_012183 [Aspergillus bombycis]OGM39238.1 hypothetical protein ABOM_012183 [Aspergillus bombycis]